MFKTLAKSRFILQTRADDLKNQIANYKQNIVEELTTAFSMEKNEFVL